MALVCSLAKLGWVLHHRPRSNWQVHLLEPRHLGLEAGDGLVTVEH
jgi:hypothetical protein